MKIKDLPEPHKTEALENFDEEYAFECAGWVEGMPKEELEVEDAFFWKDSPEGFDFWVDVTTNR